MEWIERNTPEDSRVLVISGESWEQDRSAEWLPVLAGRSSVTTVQGTEWLPGGEFKQRRNAHEAVQRCAGETAACLETWAAERSESFDYVYLSKHVPAPYRTLDYDDCCAALRRDLTARSDYTLAFENDGATIFAHQR